MTSTSHRETHRTSHEKEEKTTKHRTTNTRATKQIVKPGGLETEILLTT